MEEAYITVSEVTDYIGNLIAGDLNLRHIFIKGELPMLTYIAADICISL